MVLDVPSLKAVDWFVLDEGRSSCSSEGHLWCPREERHQSRHLCRRSAGAFPACLWWPSIKWWICASCTSSLGWTSVAFDRRVRKTLSNLKFLYIVANIYSDSKLFLVKINMILFLSLNATSSPYYLHLKTVEVLIDPNIIYFSLIVQKLIQMLSII